MSGCQTLRRAPMRLLRLLSATYLIVSVSACASTGWSLSEPPAPALTPELREAMRVAGAYDIRQAGVREMDAQLRSVGARMAADGKLYDRNGKEIYLFTDAGSGVQM